MSYQRKKFHPALKHGGFCATGLLPGEDRAAFERLQKELVAYFRPDGPLEHDTVAAIARGLWRKQNLNTFRTAEFVRKRLEAIRSEKIPSRMPSYSDLLLNRMPNWKPPSAMEIEEGKKAAEFEAKKELGTDGYLAAEMGDRATTSQLLEDLKIEERLDAMIGQQLKRLMLLKGLKALSSDSSSLLSSAPLPCIQGPKEAA